MTQNIYDNDEFFRAYSRMERSLTGLDGAEICLGVGDRMVAPSTRRRASIFSKHRLPTPARHSSAPMPFLLVAACR